MNEEARKIIGNLWAEDAPTERDTPEDVGIDRNIGWDLNYEQIGTLKFPERKVFNQLLRELTGAFNEHLQYGLPRWDDGVDWDQFTFLTHDGRIYVALQASGPNNGGAQEPGTGSKWRLY